jgi:hypothetical protein
MDHLTRSGFEFVIMNVLSMNETVRGRHQKYGNHAGTADPPRITHASRAYYSLPASRTSAIGMRPMIVASMDLGVDVPDRSTDPF